MSTQSIYERIASCRIVPVVAIESADQALGLADALLAGGIPVAEITFRTAAAPSAIKQIADKRPELLVGAGTVLTPDQAQQAKDCGASFAVAPGLNPSVVVAAQKAGLPFSPGVMTPSNVEQAIELGVTDLKFFPAGAAGGVPMLKSLAAPYKHLGVRFIPTGGVNVSNVADYLAVPQVIAAGGTWLAKTADIADGSWSVITQRCKTAIAAL